MRDKDPSRPAMKVLQLFGSRQLDQQHSHRPRCSIPMQPSSARNLWPAEPLAAPPQPGPWGHAHTRPGTERGRLRCSAAHWRASSCAITTASGGQLGSGEAGSSPAPSCSPTTERSTHCGTTCDINRSAGPQPCSISLWGHCYASKVHVGFGSLQFWCTCGCHCSECASRRPLTTATILRKAWGKVHALQCLSRRRDKPVGAPGAHGRTRGVRTRKPL